MFHENDKFINFVNNSKMSLDFENFNKIISETSFNNKLINKSVNKFLYDLIDINGYLKR